MKRTRHTRERVTAELREAELMLLTGKTVAPPVQQLGVSKQAL